MSNPSGEGRLYGIYHSNRSGRDLWGKNQFNSTFPTALSNYMRDRQIPAVYLNIGNDQSFQNEEVSIDTIFGTSLPAEDLYFKYESVFNPFGDVVIGPTEKVDLIVCAADKENHEFVVEGEQIRALEVKLTVVPDSTTYLKPEPEWGPEMVIRPATTKYCAMSMAYNLRNRRDEIRDLLEADFAGVQDWGNQSECLGILETALDRLNDFENVFSSSQIPIVLQPIWKTAGKSPDLSDDCFDIFAWSNFAIARVIIDQARNSIGTTSISRQARSALQLIRFLFEFGRSGNAHIFNIHSQMTYGPQSDKAFAISGTKTRTYMTSPRAYAPMVSKDALSEIILDDGAGNLSPERRFDQSILIEALKQEIESLKAEIG